MRRPAQATRFYEGDLRRQANDFLRGWRIPKGVPRRLYGGVVPHAGWSFSGRTAARTWHTLVVRARPETVVLLGAIHRPGVELPAIYSEGAWETPVGEVEVDEIFARRLRRAFGERAVEDPDAHDGEHALEVHMPLLSLLAPGCRVIPIAMPAEANAVPFGEILGREIGGDPEVVVVASTDLTHYGPPYCFTPAGEGEGAERWMRENDARMIRHILSLEAEEVQAEAQTRQNACGPGAVAAMLAATRACGSREGHLLEYTTSHQILREPRFVTAVGYAGAVL